MPDCDEGPLKDAEPELMNDSVDDWIWKTISGCENSTVLDENPGCVMKYQNSTVHALEPNWKFDVAAVDTTVSPAANDNEAVPNFFDAVPSFAVPVAVQLDARGDESVIVVLLFEPSKCSNAVTDEIEGSPDSTMFAIFEYTT